MMNGRLAKGFGRMKGRVKLLGNNRDWENYRDLLLVLTQKELQVRYNNKALGYIWSIASPLASALVYFVAFKLVMRVQVEDYPLVLISGLFPWQWLSNSVGSAPNLFVANAPIIKKVSFPRNIITLSMVLNHMIHYIISIPVILLFLVIFHESPTHQWIYGFPILCVIQLIMTYGMSLILASINLVFRDLERLTQIVMNLAFYFTPILYPLDLIPSGFRKAMLINPFGPIIIAWRELILAGKLEHGYILISAVQALIFLAIGTYVYRKLSWKFAEVI